MKPFDTVIRQLSELYEFNKQLRTYSMRKQDTGESNKMPVPDDGKPAGAPHDNSRDIPRNTNNKCTG